MRDMADGGDELGFWRLEVVGETCERGEGNLITSLLRRQLGEVLRDGKSSEVQDNGPNRLATREGLNEHVSNFLRHRDDERTEKAEKKKLEKRSCSVR